jgi:hypothetical protein
MECLPHGENQFTTEARYIRQASDRRLGDIDGSEVPRYKHSPESDSNVVSDLGDVWSHYCTLNEDGEVVGRGRFRTSPSGVEKWFTDLPRSRPSPTPDFPCEGTRIGGPPSPNLSVRRAKAYGPQRVRVPSEYWSHRESTRTPDRSE